MALIDDDFYDIIVIGSGNGACGFLTRILDRADKGTRILVIERGKSFQEISPLVHRDNWTRSYAQGDLYRLHNVGTPNGIPITSGGACVMGGGGSINVAMIQESTAWYVKHFGRDEDYWNRIKGELETRLSPCDPVENSTPMVQCVLNRLCDAGFDIHDSQHRITSFQEPESSERGIAYRFAKTCDQSGARTSSGVFIVNWSDPRITLKTNCEVRALRFEIDAAEPESSKRRCSVIELFDTESKQVTELSVKKQAQVVLCAGAATPRLLMPHRESLENSHIGRNVSDHITIPLGSYRLNRTKLDSNAKTALSPEDVYLPIFATKTPKLHSVHQQVDPLTMEFFAGKLSTFSMMSSHLYSALLLPNWMKRKVSQSAFWFQQYKRSRHLIRGMQLFRRKSWKSELITGIVKFSPSQPGHYNDDGSVTLPWLDGDDHQSGGSEMESADVKLACEAVKQILPILDSLGDETSGLVSFIEKRLGIPFRNGDVRSYVERYRKRHLLSQQHLVGGCSMGTVLDPGDRCENETGKLNGATNVYVADLSASPLPRVSPQMVAYTLGFHVANHFRLPHESEKARDV